MTMVGTCKNNDLEKTAVEIECLEKRRLMKRNRTCSRTIWQSANYEALAWKIEHNENSL